MESATVTPAGRPLVGLALGSGAARGLAHIGVLRALAEARICVDVIAGTSIGALIGATHAAGKTDMLAETFAGFDWRRIAGFFDVVLPRSGLLDGARISAMVREHVAAESIEELPLPFAAVAADVTTGEEVVIRNGDVIEAVRASISVPGILTPVRQQDRFLVDGGIVNPVPVSVARALGAEYVIAVDLNHGVTSRSLVARRPKKPKPAPALPQWAQGVTQGITQGMQDLTAKLLPQDTPAKRRPKAAPMPSIFEVLLGSINIMETRITEGRLAIDRPELLIRPSLGHIRFMDFDRAEEAIGIGYRATVETLKAFPEVPRV
ncbi:patatin [Rhodovarius crocodyli]|uniref:Patatin n=1 Tax=Rhodovarius crocodyli TaxID=1979269 RepID=A0A437M285_9PROT|nr:patatin [Rhodovarius crocodyli]